MSSSAPLRHRRLIFLWGSKRRRKVTRIRVAPAPSRSPMRLFSNSNFTFWCEEQNSGQFDGAAALMGQGRSNSSISKHLTPTYRNVFSYCLHTTRSTTGYLNLGNPVKTPITHRSRVIRKTFPSIFGAAKLSISQSTFQTPGTIIVDYCRRRTTRSERPVGQL